MTFECWFPVRGRNTTQCHTLYFEVHIAPQSVYAKVKGKAMIEVIERLILEEGKENEKR